jgi:hypothetical protein
MWAEMNHRQVLCWIPKQERNAYLIILYILCDRYELVQAELAVAKYSELSVINLRRLFAPKGTKFMDLQKQIIERSPPKRKLTMDTI